MMPLLRRTALLLLCSVALGVSSASAGIEPPTEPMAREIFAELMSPFCPGRLLRDCPSGSAHELKDKIRAELAAGKSKAAVIDGVYQIFGEQVRSAPEAKGIGIFAWVMPAVFFLAGVGVLALWLRARAARAGAVVTQPAVPLTAEQSARVEEELRRM